MQLSSHSDFHYILGSAHEAVVAFDRFGLVTAVNREAERLTGWTEPELLGEPVTRFISAGSQTPLRVPRGVLGTTDAFGPHDDFFFSVARHRNGTEFNVEISWRMLDGSSEEALLTVRVPAASRQAEVDRSDSNALAQATLESIGDALITTDLDGKITFLNAQAEHLTGWEFGEARGQPCGTVLVLVAEESRAPIMDRARACLAAGHPVDLEAGVLLLRRDGTEVPVGDSAAPVRSLAGEITGVVIVVQDESEKRRVGHRLSFEATHDPLTGLVNRVEFERRLARVISNVLDTTSEHMLLCLDLDRFKIVNDVGGHEAGDALLRDLAALMRTQLRKRDTLARMGGDEFAVLLENCPRTEAHAIARELCREVGAHLFVWEGREFSVGLSVGLVELEVGVADTAAALRMADAACYSAKEAGGGAVHHASKLPAGVMHSTSRLQHLRTALVRGGFVLHAQPILSLQAESDQVSHLEVLLRLVGRDGELEPASEFLEEAARYQLMPEIDRWVMQQTIAMLRQWKVQAPTRPLPLCSINLDVSALSDPDFVSNAGHELSRQQVSADRICFEIAESAVLANPTRAQRFLTDLHALGCSVAIEDFGNGFNAFEMLRDLPVRFVKISGRVVYLAVTDSMYARLIESVRDISQTLGVTTIAKAVGTSAVLKSVRQLGFTHAQGMALRAPAELLHPSADRPALSLVRNS